MTDATEFAPGLMIRGFTAPQKLADYKLIAFDMDSTLITIECIDEIADATVRKPKWRRSPKPPCAARSPTSKTACASA